MFQWLQISSNSSLLSLSLGPQVDPPDPHELAFHDIGEGQNIRFPPSTDTTAIWDCYRTDCRPRQTPLAQPPLAVKLGLSCQSQTGRVKTQRILSSHLVRKDPKQPLGWCSLDVEVEALGRVRCQATTHSAANSRRSLPHRSAGVDPNQQW